MLRARAGVAIGMIFIAVAALTAHALFGTMWSNHCDPGNELFSMESEGADNSWLCTGPDVSVTHFGDPATLHTQLRAKFVQSGWSELGGEYYMDPNWSVFLKDSAGGNPLTAPPQGFLITANVHKEWLSVEVHLNE